MQWRILEESAPNILCVLEYIYLGEVNIAHEDVDKFLEHAKKFKLQGFKGKNEEVKKIQEYFAKPRLLAKEER